MLCLFVSRIIGGFFHPLYAKFLRQFKCDMGQKPSFACGTHTDTAEACNSVPFSILYSVS